jgi:voltage-gated potassium channel
MPVRSFDAVRQWWSRPPSDDRPLLSWVLFRLRNALIAVVVLAVVATVGYVALEGYGWVDALYMTVITLGTIGYGEVRPLDTAGRFLTIGVIVAGFAAFVYAASVLTNFFTSGEASQQSRERRARRMQAKLNDHVIVVGFGRVGQAVVRALHQTHHQCVVLDINPELEAPISASGAIHVAGDATDEDVLRRAGIERAAGLVAAADQDALNLVVVLTARAVGPELRIVSRVNESTWLSRIENAGADVAQSPYDSYGASLAASALSPTVLSLHNMPLLGLGTEEIEVAEASELVGKRIQHLEEIHVGVHILGLRREQHLHKWHEIDDSLRQGDVLVALGEPAHLSALVRNASTAAPGDASR